MSDSEQVIHRAIQSHDHAEVEATIVHLAQAARNEQAPIEQLIVKLKHAVNSLPLAALRERARTDLRDSIVRIAIAAYYESTQPADRQYAPKHNQPH